MMLDNNEKHLSRSDLFRELIDDYYGIETTPATTQETMSSHWRYYSSKFDVRLDDLGNLVSLVGAGFGDCENDSLHKKILDGMTIASHLVHLKGARNLFRLFREAGVICTAMDLNPTFDVFRQVCSLALLQEQLPHAG